MEVGMNLQPLASRRGSSTHFEALGRGIFPDGTVLSPPAFIGELESVAAFDLAVANLALSVAAKYRSISISINASEELLSNEFLVNTLIRNIHRSGVRTKRICVEVLEECNLNLDGEVVHNMIRLANAGICFALDDVPCCRQAEDVFRLLRHPSISAIRRGCRVKLDKGALIDHLLDSPCEVKWYIREIHTAGFLVIAEGVETAAQFELLLKLGADYQQGYYIGKPVHPSLLH